MLFGHRFEEQMDTGFDSKSKKENERNCQSAWVF